MGFPPLLAQPADRHESSLNTNTPGVSTRHIHESTCRDSLKMDKSNLREQEWRVSLKTKPMLINLTADATDADGLTPRHRSRLFQRNLMSKRDPMPPNPPSAVVGLYGGGTSRRHAAFRRGFIGSEQLLDLLS